MVKHRRTRARGHVHAFTPSRLHFAKPNGVAVVSVPNTIGRVLNVDVQIFVIGMCAEFPDQRVCRIS